MNRYKQAPTLVKIRTVLIIILSALLTAIILEIIMAERTNALLREAMQGTTSLMTQVLSPVIPSTPAPIQSVLPSPQATQPVRPVKSPSAPAASPVTPPSSNISSPGPSTSQILTPINTDLQKIYFSKEHAIKTTSNTTFASVQDNAVFPTPFTWIQVSEQGWRVAGVLWYWWALVAFIMIPSLVALRKETQWHLVHKVVLKRYLLYTE